MAFDQDKLATAFGFLTESSRRVVRSELERTVDGIDLCKLGDIGTAILRAHRVFVFGTGRSGLVLKMVAMRLMHLGLPVQVVGETTTTAIRKVISCCSHRVRVPRRACSPWRISPRPTARMSRR